MNDLFVCTVGQNFILPMYNVHCTMITIINGLRPSPGLVHMVFPNRKTQIRIAQKKLCENIPRMHHTGFIWFFPFHKKLYRNSSRIG